MLLLVEIFVIFYSNTKVSSTISSDKARSSNITKITSKEVKAKKKAEDGKWVLQDNYLLDVKDYLAAHPGGKNLIEDVLYHDVTRYINGSVPFNAKFTPWNHNTLTVNYGINKLAFAEIQDDHKIVLDVNGNSVYIYDEMNIVSSRITAGFTKEFSFQASKNLKKLSFARYLTGLEWMGKHFSVTSKSKGINRLYSLCLSANEKIHKLHRNIVDNVSKLEKGEAITETYLSNNDLTSENLELYIKRYDFSGAFSKYLHEGKIPTDDLIVKGPLGLGLNLDGTLEYEYFAFAAGTGIYCFLDLVALVVRKVCHEISTRKFNNGRNTLIEGETLNIGTTFKLTLCCTYTDEINAFWHDILTDASELDSKHKIGIFKYYPRISSSCTKRWDKDFYCKVFKDSVEENIKQVYLCGPATFLDSVKDEISKNELVKDISKIVLV